MRLTPMRNRLRTGSVSVLAAAAALFIAFSMQAFAQTDPHHPDGEAKEAAPAQEMPWGGWMMGPGMMGRMMRGGGMMGMMESCPMMGGTAHAGGRIAFLKAELAVTDQQKEAWEAYAAALKKNLEGMQGMRATMMKVMQAKSPVERLDAHIAAMEGRLGTQGAEACPCQSLQRAQRGSREEGGRDPDRHGLHDVTGAVHT